MYSACSPESNVTSHLEAFPTRPSIHGVYQECGVSVLEHAVTVDVWPCLAVMHSDDRSLYYTQSLETGLC